MKPRFSAYLNLALLPAGATCAPGEVAGVIGEGSERTIRGGNASR